MLTTSASLTSPFNPQNSNEWYHLMPQSIGALFDIHLDAIYPQVLFRRTWADPNPSNLPRSAVESGCTSALVDPYILQDMYIGLIAIHPHCLEESPTHRFDVATTDTKWVRVCTYSTLTALITFRELVYQAGEQSEMALLTSRLH